MLRRLHSVPGLILGVFVTLLALSGAVLSLDPALERAGAYSGADAIRLADLASLVVQTYPGVERIDRRENGAIVVGYSTADTVGSVLIDPRSGAAIAEDTPSSLMRWVKELHRSFLLGESGRAVAGVSAGLMAMMAVTGLFLLAAMLGGWRRLNRPVRAQGAGWLHAVLARVAVMFLALSAVTGVYMSLVNFEYVSDGSDAGPDFPFEVAGTPPAPVGSLAAFQDLTLGDLRRLTFPVAGDATDVFGLQTTTGEGYVDQATGQVLSWADYKMAQKVWNTLYMLHTGQGLWWLGLLLGLGALTVPVLSVTGTLIWLKRRRAVPRISHNARPALAETLILVGSEGGSTWGFARSLHLALHAAGHQVHTAAMNATGPFPATKRMIILTATYGDGAAPAQASRFLDNLAQGKLPAVPVAILGFGDRMFPRYCGFADTVQAAIEARALPVLHPLCRIDRQSSVDFAAWGLALGQSLGLDLVLEHHAALPAMQSLRLISRSDFGVEVGAPATIFRFAAMPKAGLFRTGLPSFQAGDLVGIVPPGSDLPRFYSLASSRVDGFLEVAVRKMEGGVCSGHLHGLQPGQTIQAFIRANPAFRPARGKAPLVMVAAGCGVGPMAGFLRRLKPGRAVELYFGARDPKSDFLYEQEISLWKSQGRLSRFVTAFSRGKDCAYVQDRLHADAAHLRGLIAMGGQVLVCGGMAMARAVAVEVDQAVAPLGLSVATLKAEGRYLEDVY
jgi:sulfite reductase (NADPH) flavoprotein alpha-component